MSLENALWRAIGVFRLAALAYAVVLVAVDYTDYQRPLLGWGVLAVMALWTLLTGWAYRVPALRTWRFVIADVAVVTGCLAATAAVVSATARVHGAPTLTMAWGAAPVFACAVKGGRRAGAGAALVLGAVDVALRGGHLTQSASSGTVLLLLSGFGVGYLTSLARKAETRMQQAIELAAATRERERLARNIHDGVLQVLALVQRRGNEIGGEAAELSRLAGEQEESLRALVNLDAAPETADGLVDLRYLLRPLAAARVQLVTPATPVLLPEPVAVEIAAATGGAVDNVRLHAGEGAQAWVLVEDEPTRVTVTVRDNGRGMAPARVVEAATGGRLGIAQSIRGRIVDLGGAVDIHTTPGQGVEVEMRIPRPRSRRPARADGRPTDA